LRTWSALRHGYVQKRNKRYCSVSVFRLSRFRRSISHKNNAREKGVRAMMINKVRTKKKYPFKQMSPGETLKLNDVDVRDAQKARLRPSSLNRLTDIIVAALLK
jgi:hypothetical protein